MTNITLKTYSGQTITPAGIINVNVNYEGQEHNLDLFVVKNDSPSLFGRTRLKHIKLDWNTIKFLQMGKTTEVNLQEILKQEISLKKYSVAFKGELTFKVLLYLKIFLCTVDRQYLKH